MAEGGSILHAAADSARRRPRRRSTPAARLDSTRCSSWPKRLRRPAPLGEVLQSLCARIAAVLKVEVCSIYLRELVDAPGTRRGAGDLVLRGNAGYSADAVGRVRMRVGEGLTGFAVECLRPVSVARASIDARNKQLRRHGRRALPVAVRGAAGRRRPRGRRAGGAAAAAARLRPARDRADRVDGAAGAVRARAGAPARARAPGRAVGVAAVDAARARARGDAARSAGGARRRRSAPSWCAAHHQPAARPAGRIRRGRARAPRSGAGRGRRRDDQAGRLGDELGSARSRHHDLAVVAGALRARRRAAARAHARSRRRRRQRRGGRRAGDARVHARAVGVGRAPAGRSRARGRGALPARAQSAGRRRGAAAARLGAGRRPPHRVRRHRAACLPRRRRRALGAPTSSPGLAVAVALGLPVVAGVGELFRWVSDGDRVLVDGDGGSVIVNPSRVDVAAHRKR